MAVSCLNEETDFKSEVQKQVNTFCFPIETIKEPKNTMFETKGEKWDCGFLGF